MPNDSAMLAVRRSRSFAGTRQPELDVRSCGQMRKQRQLLKHQADAPLFRRNRLPGPDRTPSIAERDIRRPVRPDRRWLRSSVVLPDPIRRTDRDARRCLEREVKLKAAAKGACGCGPRDS